MRLEVLAREVMPGDMIWFSGNRRPSPVLETAVQEGGQKLVVLIGEAYQWYLPYDTSTVFKFVPDEDVDEEPRQVFEDPEGNLT